MSGPLVSVVIPHFEGKEWVEETIRSVENQTYENIELVIVDDNSQDDSLEFIRSLEIDLEVEIAENDENLGMAANRNRGVRIADGDYISILDQDDICHEERFEKQVEYMEENPETGITYTNLQQIDPGGEVINRQKFEKSLRDMSFGEIAEYVYTTYWMPEDPPIPLTTELIRSEVFEQIGFYDESLYGLNDRDLMVRAAREYDVAVMDEVLFSKREHGGNASGKREKMVRDHSIMTEKMVNLHPPLKKHYYRRRGFFDLDMGITYIRNENYLEGLKNMLRGFIAKPGYSTKVGLQYLFLRPEKNM
ncbi:MAG: glycosyltransferase family 2 protein [Candidatus Nanohaloarchaea archaeon]